MNNVALLILIAVVAGAFVTVQGQFMGLITREMGTLESVFITYGLGGLTIGLVMLIARGGHLDAWRGVPTYALFAGFLGLIIVGAIGFSVSRLGTVAAFTTIVAAQYVASALVDHFGLFGAEEHPLTPVNLLGMAVLLVGVWLILRR